MPDKTAPTQTFTEGQIVGVVVCAPLDKILDYKTPACGVQTGSIVQVNLATTQSPRHRLGRGQIQPIPR